MRTFSPKDPAETVVLTFNFAPDLIAGETLTGTPTIALVQYSGAADPALGSMLVCSPQLSGNNVLQTVTLGVNGANYAFTATCPTSTARTLSEGGILPAVFAYLQ